MKSFVNPTFLLETLLQIRHMWPLPSSSLAIRLSISKTICKHFTRNNFSHFSTVILNQYENFYCLFTQSFYQFHYGYISVCECPNSVLFCKFFDKIHIDNSSCQGSVWTQCGSSHWWMTCCCTGNRSHNHAQVHHHALQCISSIAPGDLEVFSLKT